MTTAQKKDTSHIHLAVSTAYPVGNRRSRDLVKLKLVAGTDFDAAAAHSVQFPIRLIQPWVEQRETGPYLMIPDDLGYPVTEQPLSEVSRA